MNLDLNITWGESDKDDFIQDLFINNPKEPNKLNVLKDDNPIRLFEKLLYILNEGIHILFDIDINIDTLLDSDYKKINKYINLLGYDLLYKRCHSYKIDVLNNDIKNCSMINKSNFVEIDIKYPDNPDIMDLLDYKYLRCSNIENYRFKKKIANIYYILWFKKL